MTEGPLPNKCNIVTVAGTMCICVGIVAVENSDAGKELFVSYSMAFYHSRM